MNHKQLGDVVKCRECGKECCFYYEQELGDMDIQPNCSLEVKDIAQTALTYLDMLKRLEWEAVTDNGTPYCLLCGNFKRSGHAPDCELGNLLKEADA